VEHAIALITLAAMEIVLGIDNIVFIAILTGRLPKEQQKNARRIGLALALVMRVLLLFSLSIVMRLDTPVFYVSDIAQRVGIPLAAQAEDEPSADRHAESGSDDAMHRERDWDGVSWKDIILILGGLFLLYKSTKEIHHKVEGHSEKTAGQSRPHGFAAVLIQIALYDIIFSLDSVITAVGMAKSIWIMVAAVMIAIGVMIVFSEHISGFVERHPSIKMLALSFLILIGVMLVAEGLGQHLDKGYIYFAMAFSLLVELLNLRARSKSASRPAG
jgi:predicted tellurium resistance membrane protein TerC